LKLKEILIIPIFPQILKKRGMLKIKIILNQNTLAQKNFIRIYVWNVRIYVWNVRIYVCWHTLA